ncbi:MAG: conjugal transfer protein TraX [Agathobacter sp.]|nr:conjugal transfer protein TraX [Agathobacter sp.]MBQ6811558.1 conjugal transfer protein TraX [Agathobacter sp.]
MRESKILTGYHLKMIALITMLVDHIAAVVIWRMYVASFSITGSMQLSDAVGNKIIVWVAQNQELVYNIYEIMRYIGRMAFPIYCFLLVEGFLHTSSVAKYVLRLFMFALISEVPFDLAIAGQWWSLDYSNVFFTLGIGLVLIWILSYIEKFYEFWNEKHWDDFIGKLIYIVIAGFVSVFMGAFADIVLKTDYGMAGVFAIAVLFLLRQMREVAYVGAVMLLSVMSSNTEILALLMLIPLCRYDGTRGKTINKYAFYAFYPVHLFVLALICMGLGV